MREGAAQPLCDQPAPPAFEFDADIGDNDSDDAADIAAHGSERMRAPKVPRAVDEAAADFQMEWELEQLLEEDFPEHSGGDHPIDEYVFPVDDIREGAPGGEAGDGRLDDPPPLPPPIDPPAPPEVPHPTGAAHDSDDRPGEFFPGISIRWGCCLIARKLPVSQGGKAGTYGGYEAKCPFHRKSTVTDCATFHSIRGPTQADFDHALLRAKHWLSQAKNVDRQWKHVFTIQSEPLPPAAVVEASVITEGPNRKSVRTDDELVMLKLKEDKPRPAKRAREKSDASSASVSGIASESESQAPIGGRGRGRGARGRGRGGRGCGSARGSASVTDCVAPLSPGEGAKPSQVPKTRRYII